MSHLCQNVFVLSCHVSGHSKVMAKIFLFLTVVKNKRPSVCEEIFHFVTDCAATLFHVGHTHTHTHMLTVKANALLTDRPV